MSEDQSVQDTITTMPDVDNPDDVAQDAGSGKAEDVNLLSAKFHKMRNEKQRANREAVALKKTVEELQAKLGEYEDRDKTELEKAKAQAERAQAELRAMADKAAHLEKVNTLTTLGVLPEYADYLANELDKAMDSDPDIEPAKWIEDYKEQKPAFFGVVSAPASGQGGPPPPNGRGGKAGELAQIEEQIKALQNQPRDRNRERDLFNLRMMKSRLTREIAGQ